MKKSLLAGLLAGWLAGWQVRGWVIEIDYLESITYIL